MSNPPEKRFMKSPNENARLFTNRCRVIIVDDHHVVRTGLRAVLSESPRLEVVGEADTAAEAVAICARVAISLAASRPARRSKPVSKNSRSHSRRCTLHSLRCRGSQRLRRCGSESANCSRPCRQRKPGSSKETVALSCSNGLSLTYARSFVATLSDGRVTMNVAPRPGSLSHHT